MASKCDFCGEEKSPGDYTCKNCGHTEWSLILILSVGSLICLGLATAWLWTEITTFGIICLCVPAGIIGLILFAIAISSIIQGLKMQEKWKFSQLQAHEKASQEEVQSPVTSSEDESDKYTNVVETSLDDYVAELIRLRKQCSATSFFLGDNQPSNLMAMGNEIAEKYGTRGLEYVTGMIRRKLQSTHPYDGRELEAAWEDIWMRQRMKE